jgi:hypothetical protein
MAITRFADISALVASIYETSVMVVRETSLMPSLVSPYSAQGWMTRTFSTRPQVTPVTIADGVDFSNPTTFTRSALGTLTPAEVIAQIILTDQNVETDPDGAMMSAATELGDAIASKIDTDLATTMASFTTDKGPGANNSASITTLGAAIAVLRNAKAPTGQINAVLHPYHWHDIWVELGKPAATYPNLGEATNKALNDYWVDRFLSVNVFISANIAVDANSDAVSGVFHPRALALDTRRPYRLEPERDASLRGWELNATAGYAVGLGDRPAFGVKYTADATEPT